MVPDFMTGIPFISLHSSIIITMANGIPTTDRIRRTMMVTNVHVKTVGSKHILLYYVHEIWGSLT